MTLPRGAHRRYNPLLDEWVLCSPNRLERPWDGRVEAASPAGRPVYDAACYLCPKNTRASGAVNPDYRSTFVFDNDYPALSPGSSDAPHADHLLQAVPETGSCRVVAYSPRHDVTLARMEPAHIRRVIDTWADETASLGTQPGIAHVQIFENKGELMGCSNAHPHSQIWATQSIPTIPARKVVQLTHHRNAHKGDLLGDYLARELEARERVVFSTPVWTAVVPFWAVWPFEILLIPSRRMDGLSALSGDERDALAGALREVGARYDQLFDCEFPYTMGIEQAPTDGAPHDEWRLHVAFLPPLLRSATVRKFYVGYELTGEAQRDLTPEVAALRLREAMA